MSITLTTDNTSTTTNVSGGGSNLDIAFFKGVPTLPLVERRYASIDEVEIRAGKDDAMLFEGHAAVFDSDSEPLGGGDGFIETIARGAFKKALRNPDLDVRFLWQHESTAPLARSTVTSGPGSLHLEEDTRGLRVRAQFANTQLARDIRELVKTGVVREMSFAWPGGTVEEEWERTERGMRRTIKEFRQLRDVSLVTFPAYPGANGATVRELVCGTLIADGDRVDEDALRAVADKVFRGEVFATAEERFAMDEAFSQLNLLSPWMEERVRRAIGTAASDAAPQDAEESGEEPPAADRVPVGARERRHRFRHLSLTGDTPS